MDELPKRERESAKQRALRIPLAYHRARGALGQTRVGLSLLFFLGGGLYIAWVLAGGRPAATQISPGVLASAHARWESDCRACHVPFAPTRSDSFGAAHDQTDAKCNACHKAAVHHDNQFPHEVDSCASCHREHQGKQALLVRSDDQNCTRCHSKIAGHRTSMGVAPIKDVSRFAFGEEGESQPHPAFRSLERESDPGNIRFSHRLHMNPGQLYPGQALPAGKDRKELLELKCESCHVPTTTAAGDGAYMQPIKYAQHCQNCHPLHVPGKGAAVIPHGLKAAQLEAAVVGSFAGDVGDSSSQNQSPRRPIPGKTPRNRLADYLDPPQKLLTAQRLQEIRANACAKCHSWQQEKPAEVMPAAIPEIWLTHAKFSHKAHLAAAKCEVCHSQAREEIPSTVRPGRLADDERIMIPGIETCARCHSPRNETANSGGARFDCAQCHRYHNPPAKPFATAPHLASQISNLKSQIPDPNSPISTSHPFVGAQSCSATGCHGAAKGSELTTSYTKFVADDPHSRAFLLLYTQPSLDMVRRLTSDARTGMEDESYFKFLQQKCVGCHATPPTDNAPVVRPESYTAGVSCESCHGAAADWEFTHFMKSKPTDKKTPRPKNLMDLSNRATTCAKCHIGPQVTPDQTYDVNHDLIAAGHPRLTLEFEAQLANLPAHWSAAKNVESHFEAWRLGELATAAQHESLYAGRATFEFASHRCFDCHHGLQPKPVAGRVAFPYLAVLSKEQRVWLTGPAPSKQKQAGILLKLLSSVTDERNKASSGSRWEELVRFSLALSAHLADNPQSGDLAKHFGALQTILTNSFHSLPSERRLTKEATFAGSPYDSPTGFDPHDEKLKQVLEHIRASLTSP